MTKLSRLLKQLRGDEPLRDAAERAGISHTYLSQLEKGIDPRTGKEIRPSPETLKGLSRAYNYSYEDLLTVAGYLPEKKEAVSHENKNVPLWERDEPPTEMELEEFLRQQNFNLMIGGEPIDEDIRQDLLDFARFLIEKKRKAAKGDKK